MASAGVARPGPDDAVGVSPFDNLPELAEQDTGPRHLFTAAEAERALGIPAGTVRAWASREMLWSYGLDVRGRPMYDRDDLLRLRGKHGAPEDLTSS